MQVAYNGIPLYYFAGDTKAGDTTGQGKSGKWFVASPTGAAPAGSAAPSLGGALVQRRWSLLTQHRPTLTNRNGPRTREGRSSLSRLSSPE